MEFMRLDLETELLEVALLARDEEAAAGDERTFADARDVGRPCRDRPAARHQSRA